MRTMNTSSMDRAASLAAIMSACVAFAASSSAATDAPTGCIGHTALWGDRVIFESAGDLWSARLPAEIGASVPIEASRLTTGVGMERWPSISPDGSRVTFVGEYDGNPEVYVMPMTGGTPRRLTFHPGRDIPLGWTPDSREILFRSQRDNPLNRWELYRVSVDGGAAIREPFGECSLASVDPSSGRLAFTRWSNEGANWRGYRGGTAPNIWIASPDRSTFTQLTKTDANELFPVWSGGRVVYVTDEEGRATIASDRPEGGDRRVLLAQGKDPTTTFDVRRLTADQKPGSSRVVFTRGCEAHILDTGTGEVNTLDLRLVGDRLDERARLVDPVEALTAMTVSPDGALVAIESRGEVLLVPIGDPTPGSMQRWAQFPQRSDARDSGVAWVSPEHLVYLSDRDGVQSLVLRALASPTAPSGAGALVADTEIALALPSKGWAFAPQVSPDGTHAAYADEQLQLHLIALPSGEGKVVATAESGEISDYRFSPDGKLLAWTEPHRTGYSRIKIFSLVDGTTTQVGDGMTLDFAPRWDPAGKYLYFLSRRQINPLLDAFEFNFVNLDPTVVCALPLDAKTPPPDPEVAAAAGFDMEQWATGSISADEDADASDEEGERAKSARGAGHAMDATSAKDSKSAKGAKGSEHAAHAHEADDDDETDELPEVVFDPADLAQRVVVLPIENGELDDLEAIPGGVLYLRRKPQTLNAQIWPPPMLGVPGATLHRVTLIDGKDEPLMKSEVSAYAVSRDGSTVVAAAGKQLVAHLVDDPSAEPQPLDLTAVRLTIDIRAEWKQIFDDAWRLQRDFFWRGDYGGVDWNAVHAKYAALLPRIGSRGELNELIGQMMGELGTSHLYIGGGDDFAKAKPVSVGLLGVELERRGDALIITRVLPDFSATAGHESPLAAPHLGVKSGMVLRAINGQSIDPARDPREALVGLGGQKVLVTIADDASGTNERSFEVTTIDDEQPLRYLDWVESNRRRVTERSKGRLAYIHLPDMDTDGLTAFVRTFFPQLDRDGIVIDVRDNGGGFVSQMIIERLARRVYAWTLPRHGTPETYPQRVMDGPMAVIIDQNAGSDGDIFPESFRLRKLGPLIGTRTWGGVIGIRQDKPFVDGGSSSQPEYAWWEPVRGFSLENTGVAPDVVVDLMPSDRMEGRDPQLDRTIDLLLEALQSRAPTPKPPMVPSASASP